MAKQRRLEKKNLCLIIRNSAFIEDDLSSLPGYLHDEANIRSTFETLDLDFDISCHVNQTVGEISKVVRKYSKKKHSDAYNSLFCFLLSHGNEHGEFYGSNGNTVCISDLLSEYSKGDGFRGKPKIFVVQACRGVEKPLSGDAVVASDVNINSILPPDTFVFYATTENYVSMVGNIRGSLLISNLCNVIQSCGKELSLDKIAIKVNEQVSKSVINYQDEHFSGAVAQASEIRHNLIYDLFLGADYNRATVSEPTTRTLLKRNRCFISINTECRHHVTNCEKFEADVQTITNTFKTLNFNVQTVNENQTVSMIKEQFKALNMDTDFEREDGFVYFFLGCCDAEGQKRYIYGADGDTYDIDKMVKKVNHNKNLHNKPKLFFMLLNNCSDNLYNGPQDYCTASSIRDVRKSREADALIYWSLVETTTGNSRFISTLCEVLLEYTQHGRHLSTVITQVNERLLGNQINTQAGGQYETVDNVQVCSSLTFDIKFQPTTNAS